ncbi:transcription factor grauzone-like [Topomyia yanbarensis]|uniref:transcription factor grauzone-like n=1 Tax=Topomyia yanbarensis TaxID=2498891 RepID=UPI00273CE291|nr:transcription factor grauzone-like [Topomyia yanbarensis]
MDPQIDRTSDICRLCLSPVERTVSTLITDADLRAKTNIIFNFNLSADESFPSVVCSNCCSRITEFHSFHETVRLNQIELGNKSVVESELRLEDSKKQQEDELNQVVWLNELQTDQDEEDTKLDEFPSPLEVQVTMNDSDASEESEQLNNRKKKLSLVKKSAVAETTKVSGKSANRQKRIERYNEENRKISEFFKMTCEFCSETAETFGRLKAHCRNVHNERAGVKCCNRIFYVKCRIIEHINSHQNPKRFHCEICDRYYNSKEYLELHNMKKHSNVEEKPFVCDKCEKSFPKQSLLNAHRKTHIQAECSVCHRMLANIYSLKVHMMMHIDNVEQVKHICDTCGKEFLRKMSLDQHIKRHMGINTEEKLQCHICSRWIVGKRGLKKHLRTVHCDRSLEFPCSICSQKYPNERSLSLHKARVHVENKFECEFCGKKFKSRLNLKEHRASHTGEVLYTCELCGMTSNSNGNLYSHKKNKHPVEWLEARKKVMEMSYARN